MPSPLHRIAILLCACLILKQASALDTQATAKIASSDPAEMIHSVMADGYYIRETKDEEWFIRITGTIPSLAGAYILIFDTTGRKIYAGVIPSGEHPSKAPFVVKVPADGVTGDYKIKLLGHQHDLLGIHVPLTDLRYEVYGGSSFTIGHDKDRRIAFKVSTEQTEVTLAAYKGHLTVKDADDGVVADTRTSTEPINEKSNAPFRYCNVVTFPVVMEKTYWIEPQSFYFRTAPSLFLTFNPKGWFKPDPKLDEVKWWKK